MKRKKVYFGNFYRKIGKFKTGDIVKTNMGKGEIIELGKHWFGNDARIKIKNEFWRINLKEIKKDRRKK
jgi:hypothetical protein